MPSPELTAVLDLMAAQRAAAEGRPEPTVEERRAGLELLGQIFPVPEGTGVVPVTTGGVSGTRTTPPGAVEGRHLLYLHGGGYETGSSASHGGLVARLARAAGARALTPDYRRAPEARHPAALEDALVAYRWLLGPGGAEPTATVVAGDSAGGGLTVALLVALRDRGEPLPAAAVLFSPWVDLSCSGSTIRTMAGRDPVLADGVLERMAAQYLGDTDAEDPLASPLFADLAGLPPLLVQVGTAELLLDDSRRLAERARAAGVAVELEEAEGLPHVWQIMDGTPEAAEAVARAGAFLAGHAGTG